MRPTLDEDTRIVVFDDKVWLSEQETALLGRNLTGEHIGRLAGHLLACEVGESCRDPLHVEALTVLTHATRALRRGGGLEGV